MGSMSESTTTPETTTATLRGIDHTLPAREQRLAARRMIAAGLGLKAPRQTEEQKAYQRSIREQERKRREQEREQEKRRQEEVERAKAAVWDD